MSIGKYVSAALVICAVMTSTAQAAVIMSSDSNNVHNGSLSDGDFGTYWKPTGPGNPPPGWAKTDNHVYNGALFIQAYPNAKIFNNTGETVTVNHEYTLSAGLGNRPDARVDVYVRATQNADGTGAFHDLTHITHMGNDPGSIVLTTVTGTGSAAPASIAGYFIQVLVQTGPDVPGQDAFFDNINVTSAEAIPEPATFGMLMVGGAFLASRRRRS